ncbi:uncharacterized protein [Eurosta solidaginis]|uniref:uncharacterized protein isoform X2 n=1 Tax=Eurosta solidaginis TaxID=178769 RepID=UPI0035314BE5
MDCLKEPNSMQNGTKIRYSVQLEKNTKTKRRISFSGKKSVREFHAEEKPKSWDDSYEISDHTNMTQNMLTKENDGGQANRLEFSAFLTNGKISRQAASSIPEEMDYTYEDSWISAEKVAGGTRSISNEITMGICMDHVKPREVPTIYSSTITDRPGLISGKGLAQQKHLKTLSGRENNDLANIISSPRMANQNKNSQERRSSSNLPLKKFKTKPLKLNLRQLNAAIGDGKIVVFPEKNVPDQNGDNSAKCISYTSLISHANESQVKISEGTSRSGVKKFSDELPIKLQRTKLSDVYNIKDAYNCFQCEDMSLSTSIIDNEKVGSVKVSPRNHIEPLEYDHEDSSFIQRTLCVAEDMSFDTAKDCLSTSVQSDMKDIIGIYSSQTMELDINSQTNIKINKNRDTIYFNEDMESLNTDKVYVLQNNNHETKINNDMGISDSFILNLKEARKAALFSNCERRIEGTPHRSFLEFVDLEKEAEQDDDVSNEMQIMKNLEHDQKIPRGSESKLKNDNSFGVTHATFGDGRETDFLEKSLVLSPIWNSISSKRLTEHLTPNLPLPKRRHTLVFKNCAMNESIIFSDNIDSRKFDSTKGTSPGFESNNCSEKNDYVTSPKVSNRLTYLSEETRLKSVVVNSTRPTNEDSLDGIGIIDIGRQSHLDSCAMHYSEYTSEVARQWQLENRILIHPLASLILPDTMKCEAENKGPANEFGDDPSVRSDMSDNHRVSLTADENYNECLTGISKNTPICRRCKCCQDIISDANESFALPSASQFPYLPFDRLEKLRSQSKLKNACEYWRRISLQKNGNLSSSSIDKSVELYRQSFDYKNCFDINNFQDTLEVLKKTLKQINELPIEQYKKDSFLQHLRGLFRTYLPNWILNCQLKRKGIVKFYNQKLVSSVIVLLFDDKDHLGSELFIQSVSLQKDAPVVVAKQYRSRKHFGLRGKNSCICQEGKTL